MYHLSINFLEATVQGCRGFIAKRAISDIAAPLIGAGSSIANTLIGTNSAQRNVDATNQANILLNWQNNLWNKKMVSEQNAWNLDLWNKNNEYNTPSAMLQRAKDAGINPNLALGNVSASSAPAQSSQPIAGQAPQLENNSANIMAGVAQMSQVLNDVPMQIAQINKMKAETSQIWSTKKWTDTMREFYPDKTKAEINLMAKQGYEIDQKCQNLQQEITESKARVSLLDEQTKNQQIQNIWADKQFNLQCEMLATEIKAKKEELPYIKARILAELGYTNAMTRETLSRIEVNHATAGHLNELRQLVNAQATGQRFANIMNARYEPDERKGNVENTTFHNSTLGRVLDYFSGALGSLTQAGVGFTIGRLGKMSKAANSAFTTTYSR